MSMNFSQRIKVVSALLVVVSGLSPMAVAQGGPPSVYYQTISIAGVLKSKPAIVYVSPNYQVTLLVNGREVTGISLELSKQKLFSVTLADNHRMMFVDTLTSKGQADLNLILDDKQVLPLHLMVKDAPSGTRIYTFESSDPVEEADAPAASPAVAPAAAPSPATPAAPAQQPSPAPLSPPNGAAARSNPPAAVTRPGRADGATPQAATVAAMTSTLRPPSPPPAVQGEPKAAARMEVHVVKHGPSGTVTLRLTSPAGMALRADINSLRLYDGQQPVGYTVAQGARGRLLPVETTLQVVDLPATFTVAWPVTSIYPSGQYLLRALVEVK